MQTAQRRPLPGVIGRLQAAPYRFEFAQAVRILLIWLRRNGIPYDRAFRDFLRFQNGLSLGFPASEIQSLIIEAKGASDDATPLAPKDLAHLRITPAFIGLLGATGTLPLHYTEQIAADEHRGNDGAARAYLDLISQRFMALFAQAWGKYRIEHSLDVRGHDEFRPLLVALGGSRVGAWRARRDSWASLRSDIAAFYVGLLRQRPVSVGALHQVLAGYFGVPIAIEQFAGGWHGIAEDRQCMMGGQNATLGYSGALGVRSWRHDLRVVLRIGPLDKGRFESFLPGAPAAIALEKLLALVGIVGLQYVANVSLKPEQVGPLVLVGGSGAGRQLGWDTCMGAPPAGKPQADVRYLLRPS